MKGILFEMLMLIFNVACLTMNRNDVKWLNIIAIILLSIAIIFNLIML